MIRSLLVSAALTLSSCLVFAQQTLDSPPPWGNNRQGVMFDVAASNDVTITGFGIYPYVDMNDVTFEVYTRSGTYAGFESNPSEWTLIGTAGVTGSASELVDIPVTLNTAIESGASQAFYITSTGPYNIRYRATTSPSGTAFIGDANIDILVGAGVVYPFDNANSEREFVGRIHYDLTPVAPIAP
ncbi:hypothetical protein E8K88_17915, partial [Lampropedia aestuarii]